MALLQDAEPREAARAALPSGARDRATIRVTGGKVTVTVRAGDPHRASSPMPSTAPPLPTQARAAMSPLLDRIGAFFLDPAARPGRTRARPRPSAPRRAASRPPPAASRRRRATRRRRAGRRPRSPWSSVRRGVAVPVAAACAGELRVAGAGGGRACCASGVAGRRPPAADDARRRGGSARAAAASPGSPRRHAGGSRGSRSRPDPAAPLAQVGRGARAPVPVGARGRRRRGRPAFEPLLDEADVAVAVLPPDADDALRALAARDASGAGAARPAAAAARPAALGRHGRPRPAPRAEGRVRR